MAAGVADGLHASSVACTRVRWPARESRTAGTVSSCAKSQGPRVSGRSPGHRAGAWMRRSPAI